MLATKTHVSNAADLKKIIVDFMNEHNLFGLEVVGSYVDDEFSIRACGKGMKHQSGFLEGVELWEGLNDLLKHEDRVISWPV